MSKEKSAQFPRIYRLITEKPLIKNVFKFFAVVLILISVFILTISIAYFTVKFYKNFSELKNLNLKRQNLENQANFWESVAQKYDGYKDAYFRVAVTEYQLGNFQKARDYNEKALLLDPNYSDAKKLEDILNK